MCYSIESSLKTTLISSFAIVYLFSSNIPHFQWIAVTLIGWCLMQAAELLLWLTDPKKSCTEMNTIITMTLIPIVLILQPLGSLYGSLYIIPWNQSSDFRKIFFIVFTTLITCIIGFIYWYKPYKCCTTVTPSGHLYWSTFKYHAKSSHIDIQLYILCGVIILIPLALFWNKNFFGIILLTIVPFFAFLYGGLFTDAKGSIWCFYTSYSSIIASVLLCLKQLGVYNMLS